MLKHFKVKVHSSTAGINSVNRPLSLKALSRFIQTLLSLIQTFKSSPPSNSNIKCVNQLKYRVVGGGARISLEGTGRDVQIFV